MILLPLLATVAACWPSFVRLNAMWLDWTLTTYTHGYVVVALCVWLLWRQRRALSEVTPSGHGAGLLPLLASAGSWLLAVQAGVQVVELILLPLVLWSAVLAACGWSVARKAAFPFALLLIATPFPNAANPVFQWISVYAVRFALRFWGIPAFFDSNHVQIPEGTFEIAGGCSGLHFAVVGVAIALLMGELRGDGWLGRLKLVLLALGLAMVTNWVRIFVIILAGHLTHMQHYFVTRSHYGFGWAVFAAAMTVFFLAERRMAHSPSLQPRAQHTKPRSDLAAFNAARPILVVVILALLGAWRLSASRPASAQLTPPAAPAGWAEYSLARDNWHPRFKGVDDQLLQAFSHNSIVVRRYLGLYRSQEQGKEMEGYDNDPLGGMKEMEAFADLSVQYLGKVVSVQNSTGAIGLVGIRYTIGNRRFASAWGGKLWYAVRSLLDLRAPASTVEVLRVDCEVDCGRAAASLREFWAPPI